MKYVCLLIGLLFVLGACTQGTAEAEEIAVGFLGPLSGDVAIYGEGVSEGALLALEQTDLPIQLVLEDGKCDGKEAVSALSKLLAREDISVILGGVCSGETLAMAPVVNDQHVAVVSATSTSPAITEAGEYVFRIIPSDALQGAFGAQLVYDDGHRRLAILQANEDYGLGLRQVLSATFPELGGEVVAVEVYERGSIDLRTSLAKIKQQNPDAIYLAGNSIDSAVAAVKQIRELGLEVAIYGTEGMKGQPFIEGTGTSGNGVVLSSVSEGTPAFAADFAALHGKSPGIFAAQGYDAMMTIIKALETGARTGEELQQALVATDYQGVTGHIVFDEHGDVSGNYDVFVIENGEFVPR